MHNGFVRVDNEKMSKSLGNFFTIREVLERYDAEVVRFFILRAHYRSPLNYSDAHLDDAKRSLDSLYFALARRAAELLRSPSTGATISQSLCCRAERGFRFARGDCRAVRTGGRGQSTEECASYPALLQALGRRHRPARTRADGLPAGWQQGPAGGLDEAAIEQMIVDRAAAKKAKNFAEADRIRDELKAAGIVLDDSPQGTTWRRA
jgi:cysteinyl-tRNA synthetase